MKVVHITASIEGGAGIAVCRLHGALKEQGVDSSILSFSTAVDDENRHQIRLSLLQKLILRSKLPIYNNAFRNKLGKFLSKFFAWSWPCSIVDVSRNSLVRNADIIHLHWVGDTINYKRFFSKIKKPIVWTFHDKNPILGFSHLESDWHEKEFPLFVYELEQYVAKIKRDAYKKTEQLDIVCLSNWMRQASVTSDAFKGRNHHIIRNCVDINIFKQLNKEQCRAEWGISHNKPVLFFAAGNIKAHHKGIDLLISAIKRLDQDVHFLCAGGDSLCEERNIQHVGMIKNPHKLASLYNAADYFIIPSREDNFPNTVLESLACGTPVIGYHIGGIPDLIQHGINGLLAETVSASALANSIEEAVSQKYHFDRHAISSAAHALYNPNHIANQYIKLYNSLII